MAFNRKVQTPDSMGWRGLPQSRTKKVPESVRTSELNLARTRTQRVNLVFAVIVTFALLLGYRLFYWQVVQRDDLLARANKPTLALTTSVPRGTIRDRNGYLMATDDVGYKFGISPTIISRKDVVAEDISKITGISISHLNGIFAQNVPYTVISDTVPMTMGQQLINLEERSLQMEPVLFRTYPNGALAAHLLGFVNHSERNGLSGIELYYNDLLSGKVQRPLPKDAVPAAEIMLGHRPFTPSQNGVDLILTIDRSLQFMVEQELNQAITNYEATGGTIIVYDPKTGDILAMASNPTYDPGNYDQYLETPDIFNNPAVSQQYEPGSVFKMITTASALDSGIVTPDTVWNDTGVFEVGGRIITNWDGAGYGPRTVTEILGFSLNTGTAWLSTSLGAEKFYEYIDRFGFGQPTGVDLGSEAAGQVKHPGDGLWHPSDLGTNAFGQGIAVTPLQMISAAGSLINGGQLMQPRVVKAVVNNGVLEELPTVVRGQTISPETAHTMQTLMHEAVEIETHNALLEGWSIGGKTGTAQVPIPGGYHATDTIASFIGYAPVDDPAFIILVKLNRPLGVYQWGSQSAAPTFNRLATRILNYFNIAPDMYRVAARPAVEPGDLNAVPLPSDEGGVPTDNAPPGETIPIEIAPPPEPTAVRP